VGSAFGELAADLGLCAASDVRAAELLAEEFTRWVRLSGLPTTLGACEADRSLLRTLAEEAAQQWTGRFNPRPVDADVLEDLYRCAYSD
jgi:alcohol dehydrogenase